MLVLGFVLGVTSYAQADTTSNDLESRVEALEKSLPSLPNGVFINGEVEGRYDDKTYDSGWDTRAEFQLGVSTNVPETLSIDWVGASMKYDSYYELDHTLDNTLVEKQIGFGNDYARFYIGETDAQRLGFAKTPKISVPLIYTESNYRIDHKEKTVLTFGGWENNNEFDFDNYKLRRDLPVGGSIAYDQENEVFYGTSTVSLMGYVDVSYMRITAPKNSSKKDQEGYSIGGSLYRWNIPLVWGVELWDDKNTGLASKDRRDIGFLYNITPEFAVTYHRLDNDDLGYDGNYYGAIYNIKTGTDQELELGLYLHDTEKTSVYTGAHTDYGKSVLGSVTYKF